ncbi:MAG: CoA-binding protein [Chloroflexota bacterium]|nr:CoA-binding protein [Chloroflexota bacterium]
MTGENAARVGQLPALEHIFHPRSVAVVGASPDVRRQGHNYLRAFQEYGYKGQLYAVNPNFSELLGMTCYPSILQIPGPLDYVISCIPAPLVPGLVSQCLEKGVKVAQLYSGRFSESGVQERADLETEIKGLIRGRELRVIGPNCMGVYCPREGMCYKFNFPREAGPVGFFSQSGGNSVDFVYRASLRGVRFSKVVSYGNACDLNESDFLEYFAQDPETKVICGYVEGVKEGRRFLRLLQETARTKPVILLKGGITEAGTRAVASHTGSLAGSDRVWEALCRQTGALAVRSLEEMADLAVAFLFLPPPQGRRLAVMGGGGGLSVQASDDCEEAGLVIPPLPQDLREALREKAPETWFMIRNPVDASVIQDAKVFGEVIRQVAHHPAFDLILGVVGEYWQLDRPQGMSQAHGVIDNFLALAQDGGKPLAVVLGPSDATEDWRREFVNQERERCYRAGLPVFPTPGRAARALYRLLLYYQEVVSYT